MGIKEFTVRYYPFAHAVQLDSGPPALAALGQSSLETGYGKHAPGNMMFGITATSSWKGKTQLLRTTEFFRTKDKTGFPEIISVTYQDSGPHRGYYKYRVRRYFRAYDSPEDSFRDWADLLRSRSRYREAFKYTDDADRFIHEIAKAGYATGPNYYKAVLTRMKLIDDFIPGGPGAGQFLARYAHPDITDAVSRAYRNVMTGYTWPVGVGSGHSRGEVLIIQNIQKWLNLMGDDVDVDGIFGPDTEASVVAALGKDTVTQDDYNMMLEKITGVKFS